MPATAITGTFTNDDGTPFRGFLRCTRFNDTLPTIPTTFSPVDVPTDEAGLANWDLMAGKYRLEIGAASEPRVIIVPEYSGAVWDYRLLLATASGSGGGKTIYYGISTETEVTESIVTTQFTKVWAGSLGSGFSFLAGGYKFFVWDDELGAPLADVGFLDPRTRMAVSMAGDAEGYDETENGWYYQLLSIGGVAHRVYRTRNVLGGAVKINVQA